MVNINYFSALNISVNTTLKCYHSQGLNEKLKLMGGATIFFSKKLLGHEIFSSMVPWFKQNIFEKFVKPSGSSSCILNVPLPYRSKDLTEIETILNEDFTSKCKLFIVCELVFNIH